MKKRKLKFDSNEEKWKRVRLPDVRYNWIFPRKEIDPEYFIVCSLFGFHRCLPEILWEPFKKVAQQNKDFYTEIITTAKDLTTIYVLDKYEIKKKEKIKNGIRIVEDFVEYESGGRSCYSSDVLSELFENPKPDPLLIKLLNTVNSNSRRHRILVRMNKSTWKLFGISEEGVKANPCERTPFIDVCLELPTGFFTFFSILYMGSQVEPNECEFYPDLENEKILFTMKEMEFAHLASPSCLAELLNKDLCRMIVEYSMCPYQTLCRYVEWESNLYQHG